MAEVLESSAPWYFDSFVAWEDGEDEALRADAAMLMGEVVGMFVWYVVCRGVAGLEDSGEGDDEDVRVRGEDEEDRCRVESSSVSFNSESGSEVLDAADGHKVDFS
jgi:hypothetical protein